MTIKVNLETARAIRTSADLSRFYNDCERGMNEKQVLDLSYDFPPSESERIDSLVEDLNYGEV